MKNVVYLQSKTDECFYLRTHNYLRVSSIGTRIKGFVSFFMPISQQNGFKFFSFFQSKWVVGIIQGIPIVQIYYRSD
jgi:hypothetical protein